MPYCYGHSPTFLLDYGVATSMNILKVSFPTS